MSSPIKYIIILIILILSPIYHANTYLEETPLIDYKHPSIQNLSQQLESQSKSKLDYSLRCFKYIKNQIPYGYNKNAYFAPASEVLAEKVGYSMSKTTLFIALMRANGIPAKQHYADLTAHTTRQYINFGTLFIDHSYAEVKLNGKWVKIDSYIIDDELYKQATKKLTSRKRVIGYGINKKEKLLVR